MKDIPQTFNQGLSTPLALSQIPASSILPANIIGIPPPDHPPPPLILYPFRRPVPVPEYRPALTLVQTPHIIPHVSADANSECWSIFHAEHKKLSPRSSTADTGDPESLAYALAALNPIGGRPGDRKGKPGDGRLARKLIATLCRRF